MIPQRNLSRDETSADLGIALGRGDICFHEIYPLKLIFYLPKIIFLSFAPPLGDGGCPHCQLGHFLIHPRPMYNKIMKRKGNSVCGQHLCNYI
jgi:hypothetical protein